MGFDLALDRMASKARSYEVSSGGFRDVDV